MRASLVALALAFCIAGPVAAGDQLPFKGTLEASATVTPLDPPLVSVLLQGSGVASQLGRFTFEFQHIVNQATRVGTGTYVFTAANGDTVTADITGQAALVAPGVLTVAETGVITGGTGRFAGATGNLTIERTFFVATGTTTGAFTGTISAPGAN